MTPDPQPEGTQGAGVPGQHPQRQQRQIYLNKVLPKDFVNIEILDWIEGVGDVTTEYEKKFLQRFGHLICATQPDIAGAMQQARNEVLNELEKIKGSFYVIELKRSDEYKEIYDKINDLIIRLRSTTKKEPAPE